MQSVWKVRAIKMDQIQQYTVNLVMCQEIQAQMLPAQITILTRPCPPSTRQPLSTDSLWQLINYLLISISYVFLTTCRSQITYFTGTSTTGKINDKDNNHDLYWKYYWDIFLSPQYFFIVRRRSRGKKCGKERKRSKKVLAFNCFSIFAFDLLKLPHHLFPESFYWITAHIVLL